MKTYMASASSIERKWYVVDAEGQKKIKRLTKTNIKKETLKSKLARRPEQVFELAVKGMLPKGPLGREMFRKLHVYAGPEHDHAAQKPEELKF